MNDCKKDFWDGPERKLQTTCHKCNSDSFYMVGGKDEKDRIQVFWFCKECGYKQGIIDHDYKLTEQDKAVIKARIKEIKNDAIRIKDDVETAADIVAPCKCTRPTLDAQPPSEPGWDPAVELLDLPVSQNRS